LRPFFAFELHDFFLQPAITVFQPAYPDASGSTRSVEYLPAATAVRLPAAALSWFPGREPETHCVPQPVPPDLVFFVFFISLGNFNRQNPGFWRKASGPEHKLLRDPATQAVSLQAPFQSELICKQMQGLLLRPVDCSESLSLRLFGIGQVQCHYAGDPVQSSGKWSEVGPHDCSCTE
jgi:hypothetical protein